MEAEEVEVEETQESSEEAAAGLEMETAEGTVQGSEEIPETVGAETSSIAAPSNGTPTESLETGESKVQEPEAAEKVRESKPVPGVPEDETAAQTQTGESVVVVSEGGSCSVDFEALMEQLSLMSSDQEAFTGKFDAYAVQMLDVSANQLLMLESMERQEAQNEACISILLIILVAGLLKYIYKFFGMFFPVR